MNLEILSGLGPKSAKLLNKLNIFSVEDLLLNYPYRYNHITLKNINEIHNNELSYCLVSIVTIPKVNYIKRNLNYLTFIAINNNETFNVKIFNRAFLKSNLLINKKVLLIGKFDNLKNEFMASDIKFNIFSNTIEPIYHLTEGINNNTFIKYVSSALNENILISDEVPKEYNLKYNFINKDLALKCIHQPNSVDEIKLAKIKLIYEELFKYTFKINVLKEHNNKQIGIKRNIDIDIIDSFLSELPFKLTEDQVSSIKDILKDLESEYRMNRLVLGDVGSGKTIVAVVAILANYLSGYQSTFMAPTEILAEQHYQSICNYLENFGLNIKLLTGSNTKKQKEKIYEEVKNKKIDLLIGTHSLINDELVFTNLGLVITDEQHLFGVKQRNALQNKGGNILPDVLYLSATPIPRTYALTIYGDLSLSLIKTKPNMRKEIITKVVDEKNIKEVLLKMLEEIRLGHQVFVVSPLIETNEEMDLSSVKHLEEKLNMAFNNQVKIDIMHGKMKSKEKENIMKKFLDKEITILISTTVIEVGIDIPNATMMVIFNSERFGLAALHQLRGRVGRSDLQSYCYLVTNVVNNERLKVMEESSDGFYISEKDFEQRGQGDLFGIKQSGDILFKIADIRNDSKILLQASKDSNEYLLSGKYKTNDIYNKIYEDIMFLD